MTNDVHGPGGGDGRLTPAALRAVTFSRASMLHHGYNEHEVDDVLRRAAAELARLEEENAELHQRVQALQREVDGVQVPEPPSEQAVRLLSVAQQTADAYVAEAEDFSRQVATQARDLYEDQMHQAREKAGAIIQAAQEAAGSITGAAAPAGDGSTPSAEELQHQVVYLQAFGEAVRHQLRSYLEALISDVETEWGRADPASVPLVPLHAHDTGPAPRLPEQVSVDGRHEAAGAQALVTAPD
ncbi:DivIVA domain-containing protein [Modestobacter sp. I12A-02628]|uniref:Cell wall synthesis protein Wag31 n=1 Tax=Goekera deserti TaxID=2497753 RepID=A0A7K3WBW7_9ACTN|nr:DivIVA domain-containing protein [Goekera deserti]MPQ98382.1 DivIVA domain-containing protein [Goekera deserti]NDI48209.1 DivIVA domain-containing protein [Goekera deserti]NEL53958.1 DivIVA domain-containing protein [Goekera deserti]